MASLVPVQEQPQEYHAWMSTLLRTNKIGYTHRTGRKAQFGESTYWETYADQTAYGPGHTSRKASAAARASARSRVLTGRSIVNSIGSPIATSRSAGMGSAADTLMRSSKHSAKWAELQAKFKQAARERAAAERKVAKLNKELDKICDHFGKIQVSNPGKNLDELEPVHRWNLHLERTSNNLVALEAERRRQLRRAELEKSKAR